MPELRKVFESVREQVIIGNAHLAIWKGLGKRIGGPKNIVANTAPTFFGMTLDAHLNAAFLYVAKAFDTHSDAMSIRTVLNKARHDARSLPPETAKTLRQRVDNAETRLQALTSTLNAVRTRRDNVLAHLDRKVITNPEKISKESEITVKELEGLFLAAWEILNEVSSTFWNVVDVLDLLDANDFEYPMNLIEKQKVWEKQEYETGFGRDR